MNHYLSVKTLRSDWLFVGVLIATAALIRLDFLYASEFRIDADEAIVGLMARHALQGKPMPTFYYGQHYMGSIEPLLVAAAFSIAGVSAQALKSIPLIASLLLIPAVYGLAAALSDRWTARCASLLTALAPATLVVWSAKARGGFIELVLLGTLALWLAVEWARQERLMPAGAAVLGLLLGIGWWMNTQVLYFVLPLALFASARLCREARLGQWHHALSNILGGTLGFFIGGLPYWVYNIRFDFSSFGLFTFASWQEILLHLEGLVVSALPILLGGRRFWHSEDVFTFASWLILAIYGLLAVQLCWHRRSAFARLLRAQFSWSEPVELLLIFVVVTCAIFSVSSFGYLVQAPRYLLPLYPALFVLAAISLNMLRSTSRYAAHLIAALLIFMHVASCYWGGRAIPGEPFVFKGERAARDHTALAEFLKQRQIDVIRTNYWIGYRLAFETEEQIRFLVTYEPGQVRIPDYQLAAQGQDWHRIPLVLVPSQGEIVASALDALGFRYMVSRVSGYTVVHDIVPRWQEMGALPVQGLVVTSSENESRARYAIDGSVATRWGTGAHQHPEMWFSISFSTPRRIRGIDWEMGHWRHDYPRQLEIEVLRPDGTTETVLRRDAYAAIRYYLAGRSSYRIVFPAKHIARITLRQLGRHPIFDWSIAEVSVLQ